MAYLVYVNILIFNISRPQIEAAQATMLCEHMNSTQILTNL